MSVVQQSYIPLKIRLNKCTLHSESVSRILKEEKKMCVFSQSTKHSKLSVGGGRTADTQ